jgi:uncharacterized protein YciI
MAGKQAFIVISTAGKHRDLDKGAREQAYWDEHESFIDALVDNGFIMMGGPLPDEGGGLLIVRAESEAEVRRVMSADPWYKHQILKLVSVKRWEIFIDKRA